MATITVNVPDDVAQRFRKQVAVLRGKRKGTLGKAMAEAMEDWEKKHVHYDAFMKLLDEGIDLGGVTYAKREELYEERLRRIRH